MTTSKSSTESKDPGESQGLEIPITINGEPAKVLDGEALDQLLTRYNLPSKGVAVAVNGELVLRSQWSTTWLSPGSSVEIVTIVQGG
ncbi:MAG: sulfur carrier protein ThiS [Acidimicrobiales bacterium]